MYDGVATPFCCSNTDSRDNASSPTHQIYYQTPGLFAFIGRLETRKDHYYNTMMAKNKHMQTKWLHNTLKDLIATQRSDCFINSNKNILIVNVFWQKRFFAHHDIMTIMTWRYSDKTMTKNTKFDNTCTQWWQKSCSKCCTLSIFTNSFLEPWCIPNSNSLTSL